MNEEQSEVVNSALAGHSFFITGQCGTGKTYLLRSLIKELRKGKKEVAVTSTTCIASLQLDQCATTIHHWSGILDGRYTKEELRILFQNDDRFQSAKARISKADVLLIDEIGMLSKTVFEAVEFVCRLVHQKDSVFGDLW